MFVQCGQCPLRGKPLFRPFTETELKFVAELKTDHIVVSPRVDIIQEDEVGGPAYTLFEGWAVRYHRLPEGARQILDIVLPGDMIGLASALLGTVRHSVQALTPATLCVLSGHTVADLFNEHPGFALSILQTRVEEEQRADVRLSLLGRSNAEQRIGYLMLETFDRLRQRGLVNGGSTCPFPLQRRDIADAAGMSRVHVARTLERLREQRLATIQDGVLVLLDRSRLSDLAHYVPRRVAAGRRAIV
ncbi:MAG TPA: Crp/Fnr family transcriptional regulator [Stellaceae bacterium]|nr:Crp/Fnr family transcriptional regulator [Stellaceae bacterium]